MTLVEVEVQAANLGFQLEQLDVDGIGVWTWRRGSDQRWPAFLDQASALSWMEYGIRTASLFNR
jgi:hypothetical protein